MTRSTIEPGDGDPRHGTINGYKNLGCRCSDCRRAQADYQAKHRDRYGRPSRARPEAEPRPLREWTPPTPREVQPHGTKAGYDRHKKHGETPCFPCAEAFREYERDRGRRRREQAPVLPPGDPRHGLNGYSNYGCRCPVCRAARKYQRRR